MRITQEPMLVENLVTGFKDGDIRVPNELQREYIWDVKRRRYFIDSVRKGFPFGQLVLHRRDDGLYIIDGQQRAITLVSYMEPDHESLKSVLTVDKNISDWAKKSKEYIGEFDFVPFAALGDKRKAFRNASFPTICIEGEPNEAGQVFRRLQQGIPLRPGDILHASTASSWYSALSSIAGHPSLQNIVKIAGRRASSWLLAAQLLAIQVSKNVSIKLDRPSVEHILDDARHTAVEYKEAYDRVYKLLTIVAAVDDLTRSRGKYYSKFTTNKRFLILFNLLSRTTVNGRTDASKIADVFTRDFIDYLDGTEIEPDLVSYVHDQRRLTPESEVFRKLFQRARKAFDVAFPPRDEDRFFTPKQREALFIKTSGLCASCNAELGTDWEADHVVLWSCGGPTNLENGQPLCRGCHKRKHKQEG